MAWTFVCALVVVGAARTALADSVEHPAVLLISIDGMRPDYVTDADRHGLKIPHLRQILRDGAHASGVHGVLPTSTYPSHTSILTGVSPARHGIVQNKPFDPADKTPDRWYWYSEDITVPTLWEAAAGGGYVVGSVSWPVSVGARGVTFNIPEYNDTRSPLDLKMTRALAGQALMDELAEKAGPFMTDVERAVPRDWARTRYAAEMIRQKGVRFMTVHLAAADHLQHASGPFHPTVIAALEEIDAMVGTLAEAARAADPGAVVCVVSDHGFAPVDHSLKIDYAFVKAGLITLKSNGKSINASGLTDWTAMSWPAGGSAAIVLKDPSDSTARAKVKEVLDALAADPANGVAQVLDKAAIEKLGGTTAGGVEFWVGMKPGYTVSSALGGSVSTAGRPTGTHGFLPTQSEMDASFFIAGRGIWQGVDLGTVDMREIAPTLAKVMHIPFTSAELPPLAVSGDDPAK